VGARGKHKDGRQHCTSGIAGPFGKPDLAERRVTLGDIGAEPQIAATFAPAVAAR